MRQELLLRLENESKPTYLKLADAIRSAIRKSTLRPGEMLPSLRELSKQLNVHRHTVMNALQELVSEGWIISDLRKGYRVTSELPDQFFSPKESKAKKGFSNVFQPEFARTVSLNPALKKHHQKFKYNFQSGLPDLRLFPIDEFRAHINQGLKLKPRELLSYGDPCGQNRLLTEIEEYLRRGRAISGRKIMVTHGSQEAIFLLAQLLLKEGDLVGVEERGYPPAWEAIRMAGAKLEPIAIDEKGIIPDSLEEKLKKKNLKLLYCTPLHQYPTTVTMPVDRRIQVYELCSKYRCLILEDDYDHEFHYQSQPLSPLASDDPNGIVLYVSTFSKVLFPSVRIGFLAVPDSFFDPLNELKRVLTRQNETILQDAVARWMQEGGFERHLRKMRRVYDERCNTMIQCIEEAKANGLKVRCDYPPGGMAVWLDTGVDSARLSKMLEADSIFAAPELHYMLTGKRGTHLRLGIAAQTGQEIQAGMQVIFKKINGLSRV